MFCLPHWYFHSFSLLSLYSLSLIFVFPKWMRPYIVCPFPIDLIYSKFVYPPLFESLCYITSLLQKIYISTVFTKWKKNEGDFPLYLKWLKPKLMVSVCCAMRCYRGSAHLSSQSSPTCSFLRKHTQHLSIKPSWLWSVSRSICVLSPCILCTH